MDIIIWDSTNKRLKRSTISSVTVKQPDNVEDFDVPGGGLVQLSLAFDIENTNYIEVLIDGVEKREGAGNDYTLDYSGNNVDFEYTVTAGAWVRIKQWT